jgi:hypothetical protein
MKKKSKKLIPAYVTLRQVWEINPRTRIKQSKKIYNRQLSKKEIREIRNREDF